MRQLVRRLIAAMVGLVGAMALAGCDVTGTITLRADDQVDLDLRVIVDEGSSCVSSLTGVRTAERRNRGGGRLCLVQGTVPAETLRQWRIDIAHNGEHLQAVYNPSGHATGAAGPDEWTAVTDVAVEVVFPGQVLESTGITEGNSVRFTDVAQINQPLGLRAVGLDHPGPRLGLLLPAIAFAVGALGVAALWSGSRRRDLRERSGFERFFGEAPGRSHDSEPDEAQPRPVLLPPEPGSLLPPDLRDRLVAGGGDGWERPGSEPPDDGGGGHTDPQPVHAKWAPLHEPD